MAMVRPALRSILCAAAREDDDYVIDVFDIIGADFFGEGVTTKSVAQALAAKGDAKRVVVRLNSPGGDVFEGVAIYNMLRGVSDDTTKVHVEIIGLAASMASVVALAGDTIAIHEGAMVMIHNPWSIAWGESDEMRSTADLLDSIKASMLDIYVKRTGMKRAKLSRMMDDETWMSVDDAIENGFAHTTVATDAKKKKSKAEAPDGPRMFAALSRFMKTPSQLLQQYDSAASQRLVATLKGRKTMLTGLEDNDDTNDNTEQPKAPTFTPDPKPIEPVGIVASLGEFVPRADYDALQAKYNAELQMRANDRAKKDTADIDAAISGALKTGKITPATEAYHRNCCARGTRNPQTGDLEGLTEFRNFVGLSASIVGTDTQPELRATERAAAKQADPDDITEDEREICKNAGVTVEAYKAAKKAKAARQNTTAQA